MKHKRLTVSILLLALTASTLTFAQSFTSVEEFWQATTRLLSQSAGLEKPVPSEPSGQSVVNNEPLPAARLTTNQSNVPATLNGDEFDQIVYHMLFNFVRIYDHEAAQMEARGESGELWKYYFQRQGNLTEEEFTKLKELAHNHAVRMAPIHTRAMQIINDHHETLETKGGSKTNQPAEVPTELRDLNDQRNKLALQFRDELHRQLGEEAFARFTTGIQQNFVPQLKIAQENPTFTANLKPENKQGGKQQ